MTSNERWSLDFVSDQLTCGRRFRILTIVDDCTRECLALVADTSLSGIRPIYRSGCAAGEKQLLHVIVIGTRLA
jgi:transposase InsO family protein